MWIFSGGEAQLRTRHFDSEIILNLLEKSPLRVYRICSGSNPGNINWAMSRVSVITETVEISLSLQRENNFQNSVNAREIVRICRDHVIVSAFISKQPWLISTNLITIFPGTFHGSRRGNAYLVFLTREGRDGVVEFVLVVGGSSDIYRWLHYFF